MHHIKKEISPTLERDGLVDGLGREEAQELSELAAVLSILVNTELEVLAKCLVELLEVLLVLGNLLEQIHALLDDVLTNDLQNLVLLKHLLRNVERQVLGIDDTLNKVEILGNEILTVVHDEDTVNVKLDVVVFLLRLEEIEGSTWE